MEMLGEIIGFSKKEKGNIRKDDMFECVE